MSDKITARLQTPVDGAGERKDVHLVSTTDELIVYPDTEEPITGTDWVHHVDEVVETINSKIGIARTETIPTKKDVISDHILWFKDASWT